MFLTSEYVEMPANLYVLSVEPVEVVTFVTDDPWGKFVGDGGGDTRAISGGGC